MTRPIDFEIDDALNAMTKRQIEDLVAKAQRQLQTCVVCGSTGAVFCQIKAEGASAQGNALRFGIDICTACIGKHRRPLTKSRLNGRKVG